MTIELLKIFSNTGLKFHIGEDEVIAKDNCGNKHQEGVDFNILNKDEPGIEIIQASGLTTYASPTV